jgi:hypothetical protein
MFEKVSKKLERAEYFLNNLKALEKEVGNLAHVPSDKQQVMRANLDAIFFELISAKDFFLQAINDHFTLGLRKQDATKIDRLKQCVTCKNEQKALDVIKSIRKDLVSDPNTWQWQLNNYRNSATHRELLPMGYEANTELMDNRVFLFKDPEDPSQGNASIEVLPYCEESLKNMREWLEGLQSQLGVT